MSSSPHQKLFWLILGAAGLPLLAITIGLWWGYAPTSQWQYLALLTIVLALLGAYGVAAWLAYTRAQYQNGLRLIFVAQVAGIILTPLLLTDFWLLGLLLLAAVPFEIGIAGKLPRMPLAVILALLGGAIMIGFDLLALANRLTVLTIISPPFYGAVGLCVFYLLGLAFGLWYFRLRPGAGCYVRPDLTTQLSLLFTAIPAISILVITGVLIAQILEIQIKEVGKNFQRTAEITAERVGNILERQIIDLSSLGQAPDILSRIEVVRANYPGNDRDKLRSYLAGQNDYWRSAAENSDYVLNFRTGPAVMALTAFRGNHNSHQNLFVTDQLGGLVAAHGEKPAQLFYGDDAWWQTAWDLRQGGVYLGQLTAEPETKNISIFIAVRVISPKTYEPVAVLASTYNLQAVQQIIDLANENSARQVRLLSSRGMVLASPNKEEIGQLADPDLLATGILATRPQGQEMSGWFLGKQGQVVVAYSTLNDTSQTNLEPIRGLGWRVLVSDTQANALAEVNRSAEVASLVALLALAGIIVLVNVIAKVITRPVEELTATAQRIDEGHLNLQAKATGPQEFVTLANTFNRLTANLNTYITDLRQSETKYRTLFEDSKDAIYLTDAAGHIIDVNPAGLSLFGYTADQAKHGHVLDVYSNAEDRARFEQEISRYGSVKDFELKLCREDGVEIECLLTATLRQADDGAILGYQGIIRDITEQKKAEKERLRLSAIQRELDMARNIQVSLLPPTHPQWSGPDVVCYSKPAQEVGGDFYAYHALGSGTGDKTGGFALVVGDISGKGMPAALLMAVSLASLETVITQSLSPGELLAQLDQVMTHYTQATRQNCALCYIELSPVRLGYQTRELRVANAGCIAPLIRRKNGAVEWVDVGGMPLGVGVGAANGYQEVTLQLTPGDLVILSSDGVLEAKNETGEIFGFDRLEQAASAGPTASAEAMAEHLKSTLAAFGGDIDPHDDITIVVAQV